MRVKGGGGGGGGGGVRYIASFTGVRAREKYGRGVAPLRALIFRYGERRFSLSLMVIGVPSRAVDDDFCRELSLSLVRAPGRDVF